MPNECFHVKFTKYLQIVLNEMGILMVVKCVLRIHESMMNYVGIHYTVYLPKQCMYCTFTVTSPPLIFSNLAQGVSIWSCCRGEFR